MRNTLLLLLPIVVIAIDPVMAQWVQTNGPEGGYTNVIFNDPASGYIFAGGNGFNKSSDNGVTWTAANAGMDGIASPVAVVRSGANLFAASTDKLYFSTDNGSSWALRSTVPAQVLSMGVVGSTLVAGTNAFGVYRSTNDGASWLTVSGFPPSNNIVNTVVTQGTRLLAGLGGKGVWTSTDNGAPWSQSSTGLGVTRPVNGFAVHGSSIFAATSDSAILVSTNGGTNWSASATGMNPRATAVAIGSNGTTLFASVTGAYSGIDTGGVYRSTDNGASWASVKSGLYTPSPNCIGFGTGGKVFAGLGAGIYATTNNGINWFASNTGLKNANALAMTVSGTTLFAGHAGGISKTQDEGTTWTPANNGLPFGTGITGMTTHSSFVFAAAQSVYRSADNGATWVPTTNGLTGNGLYITTLAAGGSYVYAGSLLGGVYRSSDDGANWTGPGTGLPSFGGVNTIFVDGVDVWAGVQSNGAYRSTDNGATWTAASTGLPQVSRDVCSIVRNGSNLFAGLTTAFSSNSIWISTNSGGNWTLASTGIPSGSYLFTLYSVGQFVFAGFNYQSPTLANGIYRTSNNGANWTPVNDGLPNPSSINCYAVVGTNMYASYLGVYKRPLSQLTGVREITSGMLESFGLEQNYPNPFNPSTTIRFSLSSQERGEVRSQIVSLKVFDMLGRELATLLNEELKSGGYEVTYDARTLASGTYYYRLSAGGHTEVKRMILMK
ncbi:MAG TPA: hypothetical protein DGH68_12040 [Bacteroidetes bacterium]|nr:hypothetical protein [Bacteroidota bacterium]